MQPAEAQRTTTQETATDVLPTEVLYVRRRRTALGVTGSLLALALAALAVGLSSSTRTDNVSVAGYYPGIILSFGAFLGVVGIHLEENRKPMLVAAIVFISLGVIASFLCAVIDGIIATEFIDIRPLKENECEYYSSGSGYYLDTYYTEIKCPSQGAVCDLRIRSNTCYCCYLFNCNSREESKYSVFTGVSSCWDVVHLYRLLWVSVVLNVIGLFMGIITAAILGAYKDMLKMTPQTAPSPVPPPHIMYNPTQHMLSYPGICPSGQTLPTYPNYLIPTQHTTNFQACATPQMLPEGGPASSTCLSEENQQPSLAPVQPQPLGATQEPGGYMLTPNAPVLYGATYSPFEKPPPYAC